MDRRIITAALGLLAMTAVTARADLYQAIFGGEIVFVNDVDEVTGIILGDLFTVTYLFDTNAVDQDGDANRGLFDVSSLDFVVGTVLGTGSPALTHSVFNDELDGPSGTQDRYSVAAMTAIGWGGDLLINLRDFSATALDGQGDVVPTSINLSVFNARELTLASSALPGEANSYVIDGVINDVSFSPVSVPAPGAVLLGAVGLSLINAIRRRI